LGKEFWKAAGGNYKPDAVTTSHLPKKKKLGMCFVWIA
jgi:hypothetical protein